MFIQFFGEEEVFDYMCVLNCNIVEYMKVGVLLVKVVGCGEIVIGILFMYDVVIQKEVGVLLVIVVFCEGMGYEIGVVSIVRGMIWFEVVCQFVDFVLSLEGQVIGVVVGQNQVLLNFCMKLFDGVLDILLIKMVDYDFVIFGLFEE